MKLRNTIMTLAVSAAAAFGPAYAQTAEGPSVGAAIERVATQLAGRIGFAAQEIGGDEVIALNGDETFAMASTYKVAIAAAVLDRVDRGELSLDQMVEVTPDMMMIGDAALNGTFVHPGLQLSIANVIEVMITESDNTATDISMGLAGGPAAVTQYLRRIGISDISVDRTTGEIIGEFYGLPGPATHKLATEVFKARPELLKIQADRNLDFEADPRDQATPLAMLQLLLAIDSGTATSAESRDFLIDVMSRTRTGAGRLKGLLPRGTPVANKTGTIGGVANDVGYITLPDGRRFAIAVFTKSSETSEADRDRAIAEVTRSLYDYYYVGQMAKQ
ncbi:class A beta-lactamase [Sedimentimonas flavescens]|uniref:class A beta-lactamase n=1 Tax=Sedimentimonas flavescens TaxID=2851012 RepID=UPI001C4A4EE9|nr:class A beta-lactamase [Sedimentimonas flavescens]MBW0159537.1 class A beta-lactamase [Sedimentimonas flavescens]